MKEELIKYETAKLSKLKGFDELCLYNYFELEEGHPQEGVIKDFSNAYETAHVYRNSERQGRVTAPTQSLLQKWLREKHDIDVTIEIFGQAEYSYSVFKSRHRLHEELVIFKPNKPNDNVYEKAFEAGLILALNSIKFNEL